MEKSFNNFIKLLIKNSIEIFLTNIKHKYTNINIKFYLDNIKISTNINDILFDIKISKIKNNPIEFIKTSNKNELEYIVKKLNNSYYNSYSIISDEIYDIFVENIKDNYKLNIFDDIGADVEKKKINLPTHLPSMEKIKPDTNSLSKWLNDFPGDKVISDKLDGMSLLIDARKNDNIKAYTRGNGTIGQDISWIINYINIGNIQNYMVRGECIISKHNWKIINKLYPEYSNPRNFVSGYTARKKISNKIMKYIEFVAYELITDIPLKLEDQLSMLKKFNIQVVSYNIYKNITNNLLSTILQQRRISSDYDIDGIVITDNKSYQRNSNKYPKYAKAFKMILNDQTAEAIVTGITWEPSMYGVLNPIINLSKIYLDGVNISNASGYNANFIIYNNIGGIIGPGSIVLLTRSGGVIPKIIQVIKPSQSDISSILPEQKLFQDGYQWNDTSIDIILNSPNNNDTVKKKKILHFFENINVSFLKFATIDKLFTAKFNTIISILNMKKNDILSIEGISEKFADKLITEINQKYLNATLIDIMAGSCCFGSGFGKKRIKLIIDNCHDILTYNLDDTNHKNKLIDNISSINGFQIKNAIKFINGLSEFKEFFYSLPNYLSKFNHKKKIIPKSNLFSNRIFCPTGFRIDHNLENFILTNNGAISNTFNSKVTDLIINNDNSSKKLLNAKEKGINIIQLKNLLQLNL